MRVKVCGMNFPDNVAAVDALGVDSLGFVFYPNSPRSVTTPLEKLPPTRAKRVGVFVDQDEEEILSAVGRYGLDGVQLHGAESPDFCRRLRGCMERNRPTSAAACAGAFPRGRCSSRRWAWPAPRT